MKPRDQALVHYAVIMTIHNDARRMASTLREQFTPEERQEIKELVNEFSETSLTPNQGPAYTVLRGLLP